jgi:hypothetical protein
LNLVGSGGRQPAIHCQIEISRTRGVDASGELLKAIPYKELDLNLSWESFDIAHELTSKGIQKFVADYQSTLRRSA